jgi:4,5-DOPA dioxygenase extradiol
MKMPTLFVSHGAPNLPLDPGETGNAWRKIVTLIPKPRAILVISAHWTTETPTVSSTPNPETIYDFSGFPDELYQLKYPAQGSPTLARTISTLLTSSGIDCKINHTRGLDHGAWVPLSIMYPDANIPVLQLSIQPNLNPAWHLALGKALKPLCENGVLIVGSGSITHNLPAIFRHPQGEPAPSWVIDFCEWFATKIQSGDINMLTNYRKLAPYASLNHPTDEHLLPLFVAIGASEFKSTSHFNQVMTFGILAMDTWFLE